MKLLARIVIIIILALAYARWGVSQAAVTCVNRNVTNAKITQGQFDSMVDFTFNVGCGAFRSSTLLKKVNAGDIPGAADEFPKWVYAKGRKLPGLVKRRSRERAVFLSH